MKGGILVVQGPGGVGKTEILVLLCRLQYRMRCLYGSDCKKKAFNGLWVLSPINKQLDNLASKINAACEQERAELGDQGKPVIVLRRHMGATEKHVYRQKAEKARALATKQNRPLYYDDDKASEIKRKADFPSMLDRKEITAVVFDLITAIRVQGPFNSDGAAQGTFDKRLQLEHLSEGNWILRRAGYPDKGTQQPREIAAEPSVYQGFRDLLDQLGRGAQMGQEDHDAITLSSNTMVKELAEMAVVICMTPDVTSQTRAQDNYREPAGTICVASRETNENQTFLHGDTPEVFVNSSKHKLSAGVEAGAYNQTKPRKPNDNIDLDGYDGQAHENPYSDEANGGYTGKLDGHFSAVENTRSSNQVPNISFNTDQPLPHFWPLGDSLAVDGPSNGFFTEDRDSIMAPFEESHRSSALPESHHYDQDAPSTVDASLTLPPLFDGELENNEKLFGW